MRDQTLWVVFNRYPEPIHLHSVVTNISNLLEENNGEVPLPKFRELYQQLFGIPFPFAAKTGMPFPFNIKLGLKIRIHMLAAMSGENFEVELRGRNDWFIVCTREKNMKEKEKMRQLKKNISELLKEHRGEFRLDRLNDLYQQRFGAPFPYRAKKGLRKEIEALYANDESANGEMIEVELRSQADCWITMTNFPFLDRTKSEQEEICEVQNNTLELVEKHDGEVQIRRKRSLSAALLDPYYIQSEERPNKQTKRLK